MKTIGLAGGIGSGKSDIANIFLTLNIPVYFADDKAKSLMNKSGIIRNKLIEEFGDDVYIGNVLQKKYLADIIFSNPKARQKVNQIVHPALLDDFKKWAKLCNTDWVLMEAAILFESGFYKEMDITILVTADKNERIKRVVKRDKLPESKILNRMNSQENPEHLKHLATYLIENSDKNEVLPQIFNIFKELNIKING
jgi:dephospho-CoA kinase